MRSLLLERSLTFSMCRSTQPHRILGRFARTRWSCALAELPQRCVRRCLCVVAQGLRDELGSVVILVVLYMMQGVPLGLTMGAMCAPCQHSSGFVSRRGSCSGCE